MNLLGSDVSCSAFDRSKQSIEQLKSKPKPEKLKRITSKYSLAEEVRNLYFGKLQEIRFHRKNTNSSSFERKRPTDGMLKGISTKLWESLRPHMST